MTPDKQVSPVIRISREERDASARATHLEAATRKFLVTTNERKQMSTKTNFKRIALVAVASLGLGVLSSLPTQAAVSGLTVTVTDGTAGLAGVRTDTTNAAVINLKGVIGAEDSITVTLVEKSKPATSTPVISLHNLDSLTSLTTAILIDSTTTIGAAKGAGTGIVKLDTFASGTARFAVAAAGADTYLNWNLGAQLDSRLSTRPAGTYAYTVMVKVYEKGGTNVASLPTQTISKDLNIVIAASPSVSETAVATYNFAMVTSTLTAAGSVSAVDSVITALATAGTNRGYIFVANRNAANGSGTALDSLTATVTGSGLVCTQDGATCGKSLKVAATGDYSFGLQGDGTGGTSTIAISASVSGSTFSKSVTYYAAAAKTLTASVFTPVLAVGSNDSAIAVSAVDAAGAVWGGTAYIYASTAADATAVGGSSTTPVACVFRSSNNTHYCPISATAAGTGKFKVIDAATVALATATSNEVTVKSSVALPATLKLSFNKTTYAPGELGMIIVTPLDAAGNAIAATSITNAFSSGGITSNVGLTYAAAAVDLTSTTVATSAYSGTTTVAGAKTFLFNAPLAGGPINLTAKGGTGLPLAGQVALSATASVTDNGAAALAAVSALATTVASLKTLITTLTNLVLKIQKKVKA